MIKFIWFSEDFFLKILLLLSHNIQVNYITSGQCIHKPSISLHSHKHLIEKKLPQFLLHKVVTICMDIYGNFVSHYCVNNTNKSLSEIVSILWLDKGVSVWLTNLSRLREQKFTEWNIDGTWRRSSKSRNSLSWPIG